MKSVYTILLLTVYNAFMNRVGYEQLKFKDWKLMQGWNIAFFEYCFQLPVVYLFLRKNPAIACQQSI
jgi:uncharacterized protein (DUF486 family)